MFNQYQINKKNYHDIKQIGGIRYGNGCKGTVYDINSIVHDDKLSIYRMIDANKKNISSIEYYTVNQGQIRHQEFTQSESEEFIKFLSSLDSSILGKVFLREKDFLNEIMNNELVIKILSKPSLRSIHVVDFMSQKIHGFKIRLTKNINTVDDSLYNNNELMVSFLVKCQQTVSKMQINLSKGTNVHTLGKFVSDIINSILLLHKGNYVHCDIKGDNIMLCGEHFNLIDWDKMLADTPGNTNSYYGSPSHTNPLQFPNLSVGRLAFIYRSVKKSGALGVRPNNILIRGISHKDLVHFSGCDFIPKNEYNKYKAMNADPFSLGMTIFEICHPDIKKRMRRLFIDSDPKGQHFDSSFIHTISDNHSPNKDVPFETPVQRIYQMIMLLARCNSTQDLMHILSKVTYLTHDLWININTDIGTSARSTPNISFNNDQMVGCKFENDDVLSHKYDKSHNNEEFTKHIDSLTDSNGNIIDPERASELFDKMDLLR
jgi:serine/threonine protein kinase